MVLCWLLDSSTAEAGETLGIAAGTVRKQLELARRHLTVELTPEAKGSWSALSR